MALSTTFDPVLSRVRLSADMLTGIGLATFERSLNQVRWTTVRGGSSVGVVSNAAALDDYEFVPGVPNYYRVTTGTAVHSHDPATSTLAEDLTTTETIWDITAASLADTWTAGTNPAGLYDWVVGTERVRVTSMTAPLGSGPYTQQAVTTRSINGVVTTHLTGAEIHLYTNLFTATITPEQSGVWFKSITRPFLNRAVEVIDYSDISRPARHGVFEVIGRSYPIAVTDVRGSRRWTYEVAAHTTVDADALELVFASGDPLFVQTDGEHDIPGGYVVVGDMTRGRYGHFSQRRYFSLPVIEVAPPASDVVGVTSSWETLLAEFGSWTAVLAQFGTWAEVADYVADPSVVIVP